MHIFFIDDIPANLEAWKCAMEKITDGKAFLSMFATINELKQSIKQGYKPDIGFIDFFIQDHYGFEVVEMLRELFGDEIFLIAHSSMQAANEGMVRTGADCWLDKQKGVSPSPTILRKFKDLEELKTFIKKNKKT